MIGGMEPSPAPRALFYGAALAAFSLALLLKLAFLRSHRKLNHPPGPRPWPVLGNLNLLHGSLHQVLHALSARHGPLMRLRLGSVNAVVASSAGMAEELLKTHDLNFAFRPKTSVGKYMSYNHSNIVLADYGSYWRQARRICAVELFSARRLESYEHIRVEEVQSFLAGLFASRGAAVGLRELFLELNLGMISRTVLGRKYVGRGEGSVVSQLEFKRMMEELFVLSGATNVGDVIPWLGFLDLQGYVRRMKALGKKLDGLFEHVVEEHKEKRRRRKAEEEDYAAMDMVDVLLDVAEDPNLEVKFTSDHVKGLIQDLVAGGTDTTSTTLEWAMAELMKHPRVMKKAVEELSSVIGSDRWVQERDIPQLPYCRCIVKETMRLHPVVPCLVPHLSKEDSKVAGYDVPGGSMLLVNVWAIGRDPASWDLPLEFRPERFLGSDVDVIGRDYKLLPFGSGRRMCPGYSLGLRMTHLTLANMVHGFEWKLPAENKGELNMEEASGITAPKKFPLKAVAEPRLPLHLYRLKVKDGSI